MKVRLRMLEQLNNKFKTIRENVDIFNNVIMPSGTGKVKKSIKKTSHPIWPRERNKDKLPIEQRKIGTLNIDAWVIT